MDVTFVLEESGVSATVEVPCDVDVAAAKEVACTALAVLPASVEMRIGTQVLEETCRLQDTAFESGVQVVLAFRYTDIRCPDEYQVVTGVGLKLRRFSLSQCGKLCIYWCCNIHNRRIGCFDTETFKPLFLSKVDVPFMISSPAISRCKTRCYVSCGNHFLKIALPGGEVLRRVEGTSKSVFACGSVVVSQGEDGVSVYDEDLTLLRSLSHTGSEKMAVSHCGGWVITSSTAENTTCVWDVNTGVNVACVTGAGCVAVSQSASAFAMGSDGIVHLYDWSGADIGSVDVPVGWNRLRIQFTPCGKYFVCTGGDCSLHQYDVSSMSCVRVIPGGNACFEISPCSRVVLFSKSYRDSIKTRHLHPHNSEVVSDITKQLQHPPQPL